VSVGGNEVVDVTSADDELDASKVLVTGLSRVQSANSPATFTVDTSHARQAQLDVTISVCTFCFDVIFV